MAVGRGALPIISIMASVLVTGASGFIGAHVFRLLAREGHEVTGTYHGHTERVPVLKDAPGVTRTVPLDLRDDASIEAAFRAAWPEVIIHTAAISELKSCEVDPELARRVNVEATLKLARLGVSFGARFVFCSTDQVFDGSEGGLTEESEAGPIHTYGETKLAAERELSRLTPNVTSARIALVYGASPGGDRSASEKVVHALRAGAPPRLFTDERRTPILVDDVARVLVDLLTERDLPVLHVAGPDAVTRHEFGVRVARAFGLDEGRIEAVKMSDLDLLPRRPSDLTLDTRRLRARLPHAPRPLDVGLAWLAEQATEVRAG